LERLKTTCNADDEEGNLVGMLGDVYVYLTEGAHWKGNLHTVIYNNFGPVAPDIVEQVIHDPDSFIPHQFIIRLKAAFSLNRRRTVSERTSENAGATIFLNFFHSSPSEATMFIPKTVNGV
jgi:hypothetical protein